MDREKQIEEMTNKIYETLMLEAECPLSGMDCAIIADLLVNKGYRKATDVAREIFAEIEQTAKSALILLKFERDEDIRTIKSECYEDLLGYIAELKKKYTENRGLTNDRNL